MAARCARAAEGDAGDRRPQHLGARRFRTAYGRVQPGTERSRPLHWNYRPPGNHAAKFCRLYPEEPLADLRVNTVSRNQSVSGNRFPVLQPQR